MELQASVSETATGSSTGSVDAMYAMATMYYDQGRSQSSIARAFGVSAATVSRYLQSARDLGIVRIEVVPPIGSAKLARTLASVLDLRHVEVADTPSNGLGIAGLTPAFARAVSAVPVPKGGIVAFGWGQTIWSVVQGGVPTLKDVELVPASGGIQASANQFQITEIVRRAARPSNLKIRFLHAPYLPSASLYASLMADPDVAELAAIWSHLDLAVVGIGLPYRVDVAAGGTIVTPQDSALIDSSGDILLHYFAESGAAQPWASEHLLVAMTRDQVLATKNVIAVAVGREKVPGIIGAARAGLITVLVTDAPTASAVLARVRGESGG